MIKDSNGKTPMDMDPGFLIDFVDDVGSSLEVLCAESNAIWFHLLQLPDDFGVCDLISSLVSEYPSLAEVEDANGRKAVNVATLNNAKAITSVLLIHGRYIFLTPNVII